MLSWNSKSVRWDVYEINSSTPVTSRGGWHLTVFTEPNRVGTSDIPIPSSPSALAYKSSLFLANLHKNVQRRDQINTDPIVFTTTSKSLVGGSGRPLYSGVRGDQGSILGETRVDHSTWLQERLDTFRKFDELSKKARLSTQAAMIQTSKPGDTWNTTRQQERIIGKAPEQARELFITDGRDAHELSERKGPQDFNGIVKYHRQVIFKSFKVPMQVTGESNNSERLAGSDRLNQMSVSRFDTHIKFVRSTVQSAMDKLSSIVVKSEDIKLRIWPCISAFNLSQIEPIITPEASLHLHQCVYEQPAYYFDKSKIKIKQKMMLEGTLEEQGPEVKGHVSSKHDAGGSGQSVRVPAKRKKMSDKQKTDRATKKASP